MSMPADGPASMYRNSFDDVTNFLEKYHGKKYKVPTYIHIHMHGCIERYIHIYVRKCMGRYGTAVLEQRCLNSGV